MNEADHIVSQRAACKLLMPHCKLDKHADRGTAGYPDTTLAWRKVTSWWEFKFWNEGPFKSYPQQEIKIQQLAQQAMCYYVIFELVWGQRTTYIVEPKNIETWRETPLVAVPAYDYAFVARFMRILHLTGRATR